MYKYKIKNWKTIRYDEEGNALVKFDPIHHEYMNLQTGECWKGVYNLDVPATSKRLLERAKKKAENIQPQGICQYCEKPFKDKTKNQNRKYCSENCRKQAYRQRQRERSIYNINEEKLYYNTNRIEDWVIDDTYNHNKFFNAEFNQNDENWMLGNSTLFEHRFPETQKEREYVDKTMNDLKKEYIKNKLPLSVWLQRV